MYTLKTLRGNLSIDELAKVLGLTRDAIYKIERGERIPNLDTILKYYKYFNPPARTFLANIMADLSKS